MAHTEVAVNHNWAADQWDWPLQANDGVVKVHNDNHRFEVGLAVADFRPDEIKVSMINDELVIHARHESRSDKHGTVAREVHRTYRMPADIDKASLKSHLSQHGTLVITANKKQQ